LLVSGGNIGESLLPEALRVSGLREKLRAERAIERLTSSIQPGILADASSGGGITLV
jgi:hypothetical protein